MRNVSSLFEEILSGNHSFEYKFDIADNATYYSDSVFSASITKQLFAANGFDIGNVCSAMLKLDIIPQGSIPRMGKITVSMRAINATQQSEWIQKGVFYIDTRSKTYHNRLSLECYDKALMMEQPLANLYKDVPQVYPKSMHTILTDVSEALSLPIDKRTVVNPTYMIDHPNDLTIRDILGYIASAHGGNFVITENEELRLVVLGVEVE